MPEPRYQVRPYQPGDEHGILALFNTVFSEGDAHFQARTLEQWRWEYAANPAGQQIIVAVEPEGRIIGHYACLPAKTNLSGETVLAGQGVDSMVHPQWRRGLQRDGPFLQVAREYFATWGNDRVCAFGYGLPNRRALPIGTRVIGYVPITKALPTLFRNLYQDPDDTKVGAVSGADADLREVRQFSADVDALWQKLKPQFQLSIIRDHRFLQWRYADCALASYRLFEIRNGAALRGWFVTRAGWQGVPILALADFFADPDDLGALSLALRTAVKVARESEQARVEAWFPEKSAFFRNALELGLKTEPSPVALCLMLYRKDLSLDWFAEHWHYTIGDSDLF